MPCFERGPVDAIINRGTESVLKELSSREYRKERTLRSSDLRAMMGIHKECYGDKK